MALFTTYTDANKVTDNALQIRYSVEGSTLVVGGTEYVHWEVHRYATKNYRYVGMDEATAKACAEAKVGKYTRNKFVWGVKSSTGYEHNDCLVCQASVQAVHESGAMWRTDIQVNEDDVRHVQGTKPTSLASLFTDIVNDYDE